MAMLRVLIFFIRRLCRGMNLSCCLKFPLLLLALLTAACSPAITTPTPVPVCWECPVEGMADLTWGLQTPEHLLQPDAVKTGDEFDISAYFEVLDRLSMEQGYVLDYVYWYDGMGGRPLLYARRAADAPFENHSAYLAARQEPSLAHLDHVQIDGSAEGFFQLVVLRLMGDQFYRWWHAMLGDTTIITSQAGLEAHRPAVEGTCTEPFDPVLQTASRLALEPRVDFEEELVLVSLHTFSTYSGLQRKTFSINRDFPHKFVGEQTETLVEYFCGVVP